MNCIDCRACTNDNHDMYTLRKIMCILRMLTIDMCTQSFRQLGSIGVT